MSKQRITFQNWIVEIGFDPSRRLTDPESCGPEAHRYDTQLQREINSEVSEALKILSENEREFIRQFYFFGRTYNQIARSSGRRVHKLEALHDRAMRKLRKSLTPFVRERFGIEIESEVRSASQKNEKLHCPICESEYRGGIDKIISERNRSDTWRPVIRLLRDHYGLRIKSPQQLIGHEKYH